MRAAIVILIVLSVFAGANADAAEFYPLGFGISTNFYIPVISISADGSVVVGSSLDNQLIRWTRDGGGEVLLEDAFTAGISGDGETMVTTRLLSQGTPDLYEALIIRGDTISALPADRPIRSSEARVISEDGSTVAGNIRLENLDREFVGWHHESMFDIPIRVALSAISGDGSVVVGSRFRWSELTGLVELPAPPDGATVIGVSETGRWTVGTAYADSSLDRVALLWDGLSEPQELPAPFEDWGSGARDVTADGSLVVGRLARPIEEGNDPNGRIVAGLWAQGSERMMLLQDLLKSQYGLGDELEGWILSGIYDVTSDGRHLAGHAYDPDGVDEAFLVDLGIRGDLNGDETLDIIDLNELVAAIVDRTNDLQFDLNWSNVVDMSDLEYWVHSAKQTYFGDANLDGEFNSGDLVSVFQSGQYEDAIVGNSTWDTGDWNADGEFSTSDLVTAFQDGGYEQGPRSAVPSVPEPATVVNFLIGLFTLLVSLGRRRI